MWNAQWYLVIMKHGLFQVMINVCDYETWALPGPGSDSSTNKLVIRYTVPAGSCHYATIHLSSFLSVCWIAAAGTILIVGYFRALLYPCVSCDGTIMSIALFHDVLIWFCSGVRLKIYQAGTQIYSTQIGFNIPTKFNLVGLIWRFCEWLVFEQKLTVTTNQQLDFVLDDNVDWSVFIQAMFRFVVLRWCRSNDFSGLSIKLYGESPIGLKTESFMLTIPLWFCVRVLCDRSTVCVCCTNEWKSWHVQWQLYAEWQQLQWVLVTVCKGARNCCFSCYRLFQLRCKFVRQ